ncbi:MAG: glycoside hydrolase family 78 protein [Clostridia bacterium]|nr:glycoside hydrolase family 78 protein [Clostridia bacterium]
MNFPTKFFRATDTYNTYEKHVNAPYIRKTFDVSDVSKAEILISGLGFYDLWINGTKITKGLLAPYISNPDDIVYFDRYDIADLLTDGRNAIGIMLGNGMQNAHGGRVWDFDIARFRSVPCFALTLTVTDKNGNETVFNADESFLCHPSHIIFDDLRSGTFCDANLMLDGWNTADFDDSDWCHVKPAENPRGEYRICEADPIVITKELMPTEIKEVTLSDQFDNRENMRLDTQFKFTYRGQKGIMYDFGVNTAGIFRLKIKGSKGQKIFIQFCEHMKANGEPAYGNTGSFYPDGYGQTSYFVCSGNEDVFEPPFTYIGYRYAVVFGLEKEQAVPETLTMLVANSDLKERASFECSDPVMNALRDMSRVSDLANFYYFPTDCPHREKNGWTGDAAVSAERVVMTLTPEKSYREWLRNICAAQAPDGRLPGIVPTGGWGFAWGNGPAWDNVMTELCWQMYRLRGDLTPAKECSENMLRYLSYISQVRRPDGLVAIGLGDWLQPGKEAGAPVCPLYVTDSVISMYIAEKSRELFAALGLEMHKNFADSLYNELRSAIRKNLIDFTTMTVLSRSQTAQAICIYYGVFDDCEKQAAGKVLVDLIHEADDHFDCGMIGIRTVFHVLSDLGEGELAYRMITRRDYPSYGMFIDYGYTSLPEDFLNPDEIEHPNSLNHHFMGDIINWFMQRVTGIRPNPRRTSPCDFDITPDFISTLNHAKAHYDAPCGKVSVDWKRENGIITLNIECPDESTGFIKLPKNYVFHDDNPRIVPNNMSVLPLKAGKYIIKQK